MMRKIVMKNRAFLLILISFFIISCGLFSTKSLGIGSTQISPKDGMKLLYVPAGEFQMGSTETLYQAGVTLCVNAGDAQSDCEKWTDAERPAHNVYLDAFWIDQTEVTNGMYAKCVVTGNCQVPYDTKSSTRSDYYNNSQYVDYPVIYVDWNLAEGYCKWAGRQLPTEAQWEKAARGTDGRTYPWGEGIDCQKANYWEETGNCKDDTTQVGSYPAGASPYGALDMAGNVQEWVADWFDSSYYSQSPSRNPQGPSNGNSRVLRGGSRNSIDWGTRTANREVTSIDRSPIIGFRCAVNAAPLN